MSETIPNNNIPVVDQILSRSDLLTLVPALGNVVDTDLSKPLIAVSELPNLGDPAAYLITGLTIWVIDWKGENIVIFRETDDPDAEYFLKLNIATDPENFADKSQNFYTNQQFLADLNSGALEDPDLLSSYVDNGSGSDTSGGEGAPITDGSVIYGTEQSDRLIGTLATEEIYGYGGYDTLGGSAGNDALFGGGDDDMFVFTVLPSGLVPTDSVSARVQIGLEGALENSQLGVTPFVMFGVAVHDPNATAETEYKISATVELPDGRQLTADNPFPGGYIAVAPGELNVLGLSLSNRTPTTEGDQLLTVLVNGVSSMIPEGAYKLLGYTVYADDVEIYSETLSTPAVVNSAGSNNFYEPARFEFIDTTDATFLPMAQTADGGEGINALYVHGQESEFSFAENEDGSFTLIHIASGSTMTASNVDEIIYQIGDQEVFRFAVEVPLISGVLPRAELFELVPQLAQAADTDLSRPLIIYGVGSQDFYFSDYDGMPVAQTDDLFIFVVPWKGETIVVGIPKNLESGAALKLNVATDPIAQNSNFVFDSEFYTKFMTGELQGFDDFAAFIDDPDNLFGLAPLEYLEQAPDLTNVTTPESIDTETLTYTKLSPGSDIFETLGAVTVDFPRNINAGDGNDFIQTGPEQDLISAGAGNDAIFLWGSDVALAGFGDDRLEVNFAPSYVLAPESGYQLELLTNGFIRSSQAETGFGYFRVGYNSADPWSGQIQAGGQIDTDYGSIWINPFNNGNQIGSGFLFFDGGLLGAMVQLVEADEGLAANIFLVAGKIVDGVFEQGELPNGNYTLSSFNLQADNWLGDLYSNGQNQFTLSLPSGHDVGAYNYINNSPALGYKQTNLYVDGGENFDVLETANTSGDFQLYDGADFAALIHKASGSTVKLLNVEEIAFANETIQLSSGSGSYAAPVTPPDVEYYVESYLTNEGRVTEQFVRGSAQDDVIIYQGNMDGGAGNDILVEDFDPELTPLGDKIEGGKGNDFIDGGAIGESGDSTKDLNRAIFDGPAKNFTFETLAYSAGNDKTQIDDLISSLGLAGAEDYLVDGQDYIIVTDSRGDSGLGTDILANIQVLEFEDRRLTLEASLNTKTGTEQIWPNNFYVSPSMTAIETGVMERPSRWIPNETEIFSDSYGWDVYEYSLEGAEAGDTYVVFFRRYHADAPAFDGYVDGPVYTRSEDGVYAVAQIPYVELQALGSSLADDIIDASAHPDGPTRSFISGDGGNDILLGTDGRDQISGGSGNDFIDARGEGQQVDQINYQDIVQSRFDISSITYAGDTNKAELEALLEELGLSSALDYLVEGQQYLILDDKRGDNGVGTDIIANVETIAFKDNWLNLEANEWVYVSRFDKYPNDFYVSADDVPVETGVQERLSSGGSTQSFSDWHYGQDFGWDVYAYDYAEGDPEKDYFVFFKRNNAEAGSSEGYIEGPIFTRNSSGQYIAVFDSVAELNAQGSAYLDDVIDAANHPDAPGRANIEGYGGNDILIATTGADFIRGGEGNDFIDGRGSASKVNQWDNDHVRYEGAFSQYDLIYYDMSDAANVEALQSRLDELGIVVGDYFNDEAAFYIEVSDQLSGRDGTDIVTGVDQLEFNDQSLRLGVYERTYEQEQHVRTPWSYRPSEGESALETIESYRDPWGNEQQKYAGVQGVWKVYVYNDEDPNTDYYVVYNEVEEDWGSYGWVRSLVTRESDGNGGYYYREATETITRFDADGSYFNDVITSDADDVYINAQAGDDYIAVTGSGWIDAGDGNDIIFGGARQNEIRGGAGNDIIVGGGDGEAGNDALQDRARYQGEQKFFDVKQVRFLGEPMSIKDAIGNKVYQISLSATGAGELRYSGGEEIVLELALGESFIVVTDLLPAKFGGQGVDILSGIERIEFEGDQWTSIDTSVYFYDDAWSNQTEAQGSVFDDMIDLRAGRAINVDAVVERGSSASDIQVEGKLHASNIRGNAGDDIMLGGYGRDFFNPGKGDDFIDGGSASDLEDLIATLTPYRADVTLIDPQSSIEGTFNVYRVHNNGYEFWALRADDNSLFRIRYDEPSDSFSTPDLNEQNNDRWANNDTVQYSGTKLRYEISTVYLKLDESGIAVRDLDGNYDVIEESAFAGEEGYERFFRVKDVLPDAAGGVGTDYLRNIEELYFSDGSEQLAVIADGWVDRYDRNDWSWQPPRNADWSYDLSSAIDTIASYQNMWGGENQNNSTNSQWVVFAYNDADGNPITQDNGQQLFIIWNSQSDEGGGNWGWSERLVTQDSNGGYTEAFYTQARSSVRGTFADDAIDQTADIQSNDQIHGDAGDDLILAGDGRDRIQGGMGNDVIWGGDQNSYGWEFDGDVAFYKGPQSQYLITRDIFVRADENGLVETDAKGRFVVYAEEPVSGKGITSGTTELALTAENGFLSAVIVTDTLPDSQDGEGVDILIGIEGLVFGIDNDWLPSVGSYIRSGDSIGDGGIFISLSSTFNVESWQGGNNGNETIIRVNMYGTDFDDDIQLPDSDSIIFNSQGIGYPASLISFANFSADAGDDSYTGRDGVYSEIRYLGSSEDYELTSNLDGSINIRDLELGDDNTGTDTLINIDRVYFEGDHQHIDLSTSNSWQGYRNNYNGTQFNDVLDGRAGLSFNTQDNDYSGNNGYAPTLSDDMLGFRDDFSAGAGNDILLGGYGGDRFAAGEGDDYMDGGRDDDLAAILAVSTPIAQGVMLVDPQDSVEAGFEIHSVLNGELEYWAVRDDGSYFRVNAETQAGETLSFETVDFGSQNNNWYALDRVNYSGPKARYNIDEVYIKIDAEGLPIRTDDGYQTLEVADYQDEAGFIKVIRVTDRLPIEAGGTGVDYLRNIDEISFSDGVERLAVQNQIWSERHEQNDWNWRPTEIAGGYDLTSGEEITSYEGVWADTWTDVVSKENQSWDNSTWLVFRYTDENGTPISVDGEDIYVLWHSHQDESGNNNWGWSDRLLTRTQSADGSIVYSQTFSTQYRGNIRATLADDVIDQATGDLNSNDEIFAYAGDDVIYAGDGRDRIQGGTGNDVIWGGAQNSIGWDYDGDIAYYASDQGQYRVIRDVYVKVVDGVVEKNAAGKYLIYGVGENFAARSTARAITTDQLSEENNFYLATLVIDQLTDDLGGEGVDILIGVEGLVFGQQTDWLPHVGSYISSGDNVGNGATFVGLTPTERVENYGAQRLVISGTKFNDSIIVTGDEIYFDQNGVAYSADSFEAVGLEADEGDDLYDVSYFEELGLEAWLRGIRYFGSRSDYNLSRNEDGSIRVESIDGSQHDTGIDTLYGIGELTFDNGQIRTSARIEGNAVYGTIFGDVVDASFEGFADIQANNNDFLVRGGISYFDGGGGNDRVELQDMPLWQTDLRYIDGQWIITDKLGDIVGSKGVTTAVNIENISLEHRDSNFNAYINVSDTDNISVQIAGRNYIAASISAEGYLLDDVGGDLFDAIMADLSSEPNFHIVDGVVSGTAESDEMFAMPGDQTMLAGGQGQQTLWYGPGDTFRLSSEFERYNISFHYDVDANGDGQFDATGVAVSEASALGVPTTQSFAKYARVEDKLAAELGGTGVDLLFGFENIYYNAGRVYHLEPTEYTDGNYFYRNSDYANDTVYASDYAVDSLDTLLAETSEVRIEYRVQFGDVIIGSGSQSEGFKDSVHVEGQVADLRVTSQLIVTSNLSIYDLNADGAVGDVHDQLIAEIISSRLSDASETIDQLVISDGSTGSRPLVVYGVDTLSVGGVYYNLTVSINRDQDGNIWDVRGTELSDRLIGDTTENNFYAGRGTDYIDGVANVALEGQYWTPRDYLRFDTESFERAEFSRIKILVDDEGAPILTDDNRYQIFDYTGEAALADSLLSFSGDSATLDLVPGGLLENAFLIADKLATSDEDYFGVKIVRNIDAISFSDRWLDVSVYENVYEQSYGPDNLNSYFERQLYGTILGDVMIGDGDLDGGARDYLEGRDGDDVLVGGAWGDNLDGGYGDDILDGGANGMSGDSWRDADVARYNQNPLSRYTISKVYVAADFDATQDIVEIYDPLGLVESAGKFNLNQNADDYAAVSDTLKAAYLVVDALGEEFGGTGHDLVIDVERLEFKNGESVDLALRIERNDWDENRPGYERVYVYGTNESDDITSYSNGLDYDGDGNADDDLIARNEIDARDGNDIIFTYGGGDWIKGGDGSDFIDGGANGNSGNSWDDEDRAVFDGKSSRYSIEGVTKASETLQALAAEIGVDLSAYDDTQEFTLVKDVVGKDGNTDILVNIERIQFSDKDIAISPSVWIERNENGDEVRRNIEGSVKSDILLGGQFNDYIRGNQGDDIIMAGDGGDDVNPGKGTDYIDGGQNNNYSDDTYWSPTDSVRIDAKYEHFEVEKAKIVISGVTGQPLADANGKWTVIGYNGEAALISNKLAFIDDEAGFNAGEIVDVYLISDNRAPSDSGYLGVNIIRNVENLSFNDKWVQIDVSKDSYQWTDWNGNTVIENRIYGTIFSESLIGDDNIDFIEGREGDDYIFGAGGGDRLYGGRGNDIIIGGENGNTGDSWRDLDMVEYWNESYERFQLFKVKVDTAQFDDEGYVAGQVIEIVDAFDVIDDALELDGYTIVSQATGELVDAYILSDYLPGELGGMGNDLLIGVEQLQFNGRSVDLGIKLWADDWDQDGTLDYVRVEGTGEADDIRDWGSEEQQKADGEIVGKAGDDVLFGYAGGDRLVGGSGNDFIDGGANGEERYGWTPKDEAFFNGKEENYIVTQYNFGDETLTQLAEDLGYGELLASYAPSEGQLAPNFTVVQDTKPAQLGGSGIDILVNVEFIGFQDKYISLSVESNVDMREDYDYDGDGYYDVTGGSVDDPEAVTQYAVYWISGTSSGDQINGGIGDDNLNGNGGDDVITAGAGGDYIEPGKGNDFVDGGDNGTFDWNRDDVVRFNGNIDDYELTTGFDDLGRLEVVVSDLREDGEGVNTLVNVERIDFNDQSLSIGVSSRADYGNGNVIRGYVYEGSAFDDIIEGTIPQDSSSTGIAQLGNDYIDGGDGDDVLYGFAGQDSFVGGRGDDLIYGGENGVDQFGNEGGDTVIYHQNFAQYTITYKTVEGEDSDEYVAGGYVIVSDIATDEFSDGTDELRGVERLVFADSELTFEAKVKAVDADGDGIPDIAVLTGTMQGEELIGSGLDETFSGNGGDDVLYGLNGDDRFENYAGDGNDIYVGGEGTDRLTFDRNADAFSIQNIIIALDQEGKVVTDSAGKVEVYDAVESVQGELIAKTATQITDTSLGEVDIVTGVEYVEFDGDLTALEMSTGRAKYAGDGSLEQIDIFGTLGNDVISSDGLVSFGFDEQDAQSIFAADNFIFAGKGVDTVDAGAGNDQIFINSKSSGSGTDIVRGGDGVDTLNLAGSRAEWSFELVDQSGESFSRWFSLTQEVLLDGIEILVFDDKIINLVQTRIEIDRNGDGVSDGVQLGGTLEGDILVADSGAYRDVLRGGEGDDILIGLAGNDAIIEGLGDDLIIGGAGQDRVSYNLTQADVTITKSGYALRVADSGGYIVSISDGVVGLADETAITFESRPLIFAEVVDAYLGLVSSDFDVDGDAETQDLVQIDTDGDGEADSYFADLDHDGEADRFADGADSAAFDPSTMTLQKIMTLSLQDGTMSDIYADYVVEEVFEVASIEGTDTLIALEYVEFSDQALSLLPERVETSFFSAEEGLVQYWSVEGTSFSDVISLTADDEVVELGVGNDVLKLASGSGVDVVVDFNAKIDINTYYASVASDFDANDDEKADVVSVDIDGDGESDGNFADLDGDGVVDAFDAGADDVNFDPQTMELVEIEIIDDSYDVVRIEKLLNGTSISSFSTLRSRMSDTSDGVQINLGVDEDGIAQQLILEDVTVDELSAFNFQFVDIL